MCHEVSRGPVDGEVRADGVCVSVSATEVSSGRPGSPTLSWRQQLGVKLRLLVASSSWEYLRPRAMCEEEEEEEDEASPLACNSVQAWQTDLVTGS